MQVQGPVEDPVADAAPRSIARPLAHEQQARVGQDERATDGGRHERDVLGRPQGVGDGGAKVIGKKVAEEAAELVIEGVSGDEVGITAEAADLLFHTMVLLAHRGVPLDTVLAELDRREGTSGLVEKASRGT